MGCMDSVSSLVPVGECFGSSAAGHMSATTPVILADGITGANSHFMVHWITFK